MNIRYKIFVINTGSTSTLCSYYENEKEILRKKVEHNVNELKKCNRIVDQFDIRLRTIKEVISNWEIKNLDAVVGRCGALKPIKSGTYNINNKMVKDIKEGKVQAEHISNISPLLAKEIAIEFKVPSFTVDGVSVDEMEPLARISGIPEIERISLQHTLNIRATMKKFKRDFIREYTGNIVMAHIGGGITVCAIRNGRIIDVNNAVDEGPFSSERSGGLPVTKLIKLCFSGEYNEKTLLKRVVGNGGLISYIGTNNLKEVEERVNNGDKQAKFYVEAMAYQIAKEIGAMTTVIKGTMGAIVITGSGAKYKFLVELIKKRVSFLGKIVVYPEENEMLALAQGALRVIKKEEKAKEYK